MCLFHEPCSNGWDGISQVSDAAWTPFVARTDVQSGWIDYTLEW